MYMPPPTGTNFAPPPAGSHLAVCYRVIDLGTQLTNFQGETKRQRKVMLSWEIPGELMEDGQPFSIHQRYTLSSHEKAKLRLDLEAWRGARFKDEEITKFDITKLLGVGCYLNVIHNEKEGRTYANISAIMKLPKGVPTPRPKNDTIHFSLDAPDWAVFGKLSDGLKTVITKSPEYSTAMQSHDAPDEGEIPPADPNSYGVARGDLDDLNDPIPF